MSATSFPGEEPIHALSTAPGHATRALVRASGQDVFAILESWVGTEANLEATPGGSLVDVELPLDGFRLPVRLHVYRGPRSYTGEDLVEIHLDGHSALVEAVCRELASRGIRGARPGEFTRRAFLNGKLDLGQCEAVLELVRTRDLERQRVATGLLVEGRGREIQDLREALVQTLAFLEAHLDFEEVEVPEAGHRIAAELAASLADVARLRARWGALPALPERPSVALVGPPSVGKSTLFNALLGQERALVDEAPGTTRDVIAEPCRFGPYEVDLIDQPGHLAGAASRRSFEEARVYGADVLLVCRDAASGEPFGPPDHPRAIAVETRVDRIGLGALVEETPGEFLGRARLSVHAGEGLSELRGLVERALRESSSSRASGLLDLHHRDALRTVEGSVARAVEAASLDEPLELVAEELRFALTALDEVTGHSTPEDLLDRIFGRFCLGK